MSDNKDSPSDNLPKAGEVLASIEADDSESNYLQSVFQQRFSDQAVKSEIEWTHLQGLQDHYKHKGSWSWFLMGLLTFMIIFQSFLLTMVGLNIWDFTKYEWLLPSLLVQNLGQVIALAYVVVKSLFR